MQRWIGRIGILIGLAAFCWIVSWQGQKHASRPVIPGWDDLLTCVDVASFDGTKHVTFAEDHTLDAQGDAPGRTSGTWSFDERLQRYSITLLDQTTTYTLISPAGINSCMLVKGSVEAADLRGSWFSSFPDNEDTRDIGPYDR